jgi:molybdopterin molybdotransferase
MITVEEADSILRRHLPIWREGFVDVDSLSNQILNEEIKADRESPAFDRVAMDGICVAWESFESGQRRFRIAGVIAAGQSRSVLSEPESCFEIMTGASLPDGASLVIPFEQIEVRDGFAIITSDLPRRPFDNIHRRGSDCAQGEVILSKNQPLNGARWGVATAFGYSKLRTLRLPKVKVISTGDEIVDVHSKPREFQIRGSNGYALRASLIQAGYDEVALEHLPDDLEALRRHYRRDSTEYDVLIYSGGVSKGKFDLLPQLWFEMGVEKLFHGVSQRPGKPMWFGRDEATKTTILGLPGNPVPSLICLSRFFLEPQRVGVIPMFARLTSDFKFEKMMTYFLPVTLTCSKDGVLWAEPVNIRSSGEFTALAKSDGFLELPREQTLFAAGDSFRFYPWSRK